jgi:hypothetical protein
LHLGVGAEDGEFGGGVGPHAVDEFEQVLLAGRRGRGEPVFEAFQARPEAVRRGGATQGE